jgi:GDP-L-fucose synthase
MAENALLSGPLEPTNEPYAVAKIAGIKLCESFNRQFAASHGVDYRSVMPTNLYGPGDNYDPMLSHVIPGLIRRFHDAKQQGLPEVSIWGSGEVRREFLYVDDMARACLHVMDLSVERYRAHTEPMCSHINVGSGEDVTISELARMVAEAVGYSGTLVTDSSMPDGAPRKLMDSSRLNRLGWQPRVGLREGLELAYADFLRNHE